MTNKKIFKITITLLFIFALSFHFSCKKLDTKKIEKETEIISVEKFFENTSQLSPALQRVIIELKKSNENSDIIKQIIRYDGYAIWDKAQIKINKINSVLGRETNSNTDTSIIIPLVQNGVENIKSYLEAVINDSINIDLFRSKDYVKLNFNNSDTIQSQASKYALSFMELTNIVFSKNTFKIIDKRLFHNSNNYSDTALKNKNVKINNQNNNRLFDNCTSITIDTYFCSTPGYCDENGGCDYLSGCSICTLISSQTTNDCGGGIVGIPIVISSGGSGYCGTCGNGSLGGGGNPTPVGWVSVEDDVDEYGFLTSRKAFLKQKLLENSFSVTPCDSLNLMPLDPINGFGTLFQQIAQFTPSQAVKNRLDSLKNTLPLNSIEFPYNFSNLDNAVGAVVNCDNYSVTISQLPTGFTPQSFVEYFRTHKNELLDSKICSFTPYVYGSFNDANLFYQNDVNAVGALVHLDMANNGSVILGGYNHQYGNGQEWHYFNFCTLQTPLDEVHPVAGNRQFGLYSYLENQNAGGSLKYVFYTSGTDRISDAEFNSLTYLWADQNNPILDGGHVLWKSMQKKVANYINQNGGIAIENTPITARPIWKDVSDYLKGIISWEQLEIKLGC